MQYILPYDKRHIYVPYQYVPMQYTFYDMYICSTIYQRRLPRCGTTY